MNTPAKFAATFLNGYAFKPSDWGDTGLPILRIAQLSGSDFDNFYSGEFDERYRVQNGDLLFAWSATIDSYIWQLGEAVLNQHIFKVLPRPGVSKRYLFYSLKHYSTVWADLDAHGSTTRHIKRESLSNEIFLPDLASQTAIAGFLDRETARIDQLIEKKQRLMELLEDKRTTSITEGIVSGINPNATWTTTESDWMPRLPAHWKVCPLRTLIWYQEGPGIMAEDFRDEGAPLLRIRNMVGETVNLEGCNFLDPETVKRRWNHFRVDVGDLLISASASTGGTPVEVPAEAAGAVPYTGIIRIKERPRGYIKEFARFFLQSGVFRTQIELMKAGSTIQHYGPSHLARMKAPLPPADEQRAIANALSKQVLSIEELIRRTQSSVQRLGELRSALITAAVTGQIDVEAWGRRGDTDRRLESIKAAMEISA